MRTSYLMLAILATTSSAWAAGKPVTNPARIPTPAYTPSATTLSPAAAQKAAQQVEGAFNTLTTLQANFTQRATGDAFVREGTFVWKKPRQFVWNYTSPDRQKVIGTGTAVYFHDIDRNQTTQLPLDAGLARLFTAKTFNLAAQNLKVTAVQETSTALTVTLKPLTTSKNTAQTVTSLILSFTKVAKPAKGTPALTLTRLETTDLTQATTAITFSNPTYNTTVPASTFTFTPGVYEQKN